jgi:tRNA dimethylallyltransferase
VQNWGKVEGIKGLFARVQKLDPEYALEVDAKNPRRLTRALEAMLSSGEKFSQMRARRTPTFSADYLIIALFRPRQELYERINARVDAMMEAGFLEEVKSLMQEEYLSDDPGLTSIGYQELGLFLKGQISLASAVDQIKANTRHFAKRQINFLRHLPGVVWISEPNEAEKKDETLDAWHRDLPEYQSQLSLDAEGKKLSSRLQVSTSELSELIKRFYGK